MNRKEKLIERITACLEEFGMPKFHDRFPAISVLQIIKDMGFLRDIEEDITPDYPICEG